MFEHIKYKESKIANGLTILTAENNTIPVADVQIWTRTGYRYEKPDELGYAHLLEHMLFNGTRRRPSTYDLRLEIGRRGGHFNAFTSQEAVYYVTEMISQDTEVACDILSDMLFNSLLEKESLENEKNIVLQELKELQENHRNYLANFKNKKIFPNHPLSNGLLDTEQTTINATSESLKNYLTKNYRPDQSALIISGDISHEKAIELAQKYFGKWQNPTEAFNPCLKPVTKAAENYYFEKRDIKQTFLSLNYYCPNLIDLTDLRKVAALDLLSFYLGNGPTSILFREVREKRGLAYGITAGTIMRKDAGLFTINTSTQKPEETVKVIEQVIANIPNNLTIDLFERVREQQLGKFIIYYVKPNNQSNLLGDSFISYGKLITPDEWIGYIKSAKREDSIAFANKYLKPDNSVLVAFGPHNIGR